MAIKEHHITVRISKRVQEENYEPFEIFFEEKIILDKKGNANKTRKTLYNKMVKQLDNLIEDRFEDE